MKIKEIEKILKKANVHYKIEEVPVDEDETKWENKIKIFMCALKNPIHSYNNWKDNESKDYEPCETKELQLIYDLAVKENNIILVGCEDCCGCGDW